MAVCKRAAELSDGGGVGLKGFELRGDGLDVTLEMVSAGRPIHIPGGPEFGSPPGARGVGQSLRMASGSDGSTGEIPSGGDR